MRRSILKDVVQGTVFRVTVAAGLVAGFGIATYRMLKKKRARKAIQK